MAWILVPCLVTLREEYNRVSPQRDKGADGSIGDTAHAHSSSDHNPDETGATPYEDADNVDEVHALDIDSTGPWPDGNGGEAGGWFDHTIQAIAARERAEYQSPSILGRLQNIIWRGQIISRSWEWSEWRPYTGASKHFDHAHFSARYLSSTEADTRPWGVYEEDDMPTAEEIAAAVWNHALPVAGSNPPATVRAGTILGYNDALHVGTRKTVLTALAAQDAGDDKALADLRASVDKLPGAVAAALPVDRIVDQLAGRLPAVSRDDLEVALRAVLGSLDTTSAA